MLLVDSLPVIFRRCYLRLQVIASIVEYLDLFHQRCFFLFDERIRLVDHLNIFGAQFVHLLCLLEFVQVNE